MGGKGDISTVGDVETFFAVKCFDADQLLGSPADCRHLLNWVDDTPRPEMRRELLAEIALVLAERGHVTAPVEAKRFTPQRAADLFPEIY